MVVVVTEMITVMIVVVGFWGCAFTILDLLASSSLHPALVFAHTALFCCAG